MKKRLLSMLMAMCLMATMVPAAFAADKEIGRPIPDELPIVNEADMVQAEEIPAPLSTGWSGTGTKDDPYLIYTADGFVAVANMFNNYIGEKYIRLENSIDLSGKTVPEWSGFIKWFEGDFDGNNKTISNIPENRYLIYATHNATIHDLTLDLGGQAGTLVYYSFRVNKAGGVVDWGEDTFRNINVVSTKNGENATVQLAGNAQANYAPFLFASGPYFTMEDCNNYANINGDTYASAFYGYYPLPASGYPTEDNYINFVNCSNHGDITLRYAGLVFGNPTGLRADRNINFTGMKNYGAIRGIETRHFFSSDAGANDYFVGNSYFVQKDNELMNSEKQNFMYETCDGTVCQRGAEHKGELLQGEKINGLEVALYEDQDTGKSYYQVIDPNAAETDYRYVVNAYCYVSLFLIQTDEESGEEILVPDGTTRITLSEDVTAQTGYITTRLENKPLRDGTLPGTCEELDNNQCLYFSYDDDDNYGYWLNSEDSYHDTHRVYINPDKTPGSKNWSVYVSVFDGDTLIDVATLD